MNNSQFECACNVVVFIAAFIFLGTWFYNIIEADTEEEMFAKNGYEQVVVEKVVTEVIWKKIGGDDEPNR